ncbi:GNAT family N-acetyltransferase [Propionicicella superfundia]|uniref:GNAT family N-acetyltransferase n=1 Tax=Propionicicella superfundia TaxID=348582 RepID=UPI0004264514|nr:GNAT family N-acetyltransferase [Propionicicella superfundia]
MQIRTADPGADAAACAAIYAPYVTDTVVSFEVEAPEPPELAGRMRRAIEWVVATEDDRVLGYGYAGRHAARAAYRWAAEVSIYLDATARGRGLGRALYTELLSRLARRGYRMATACIAVPNPASVGLHTAMGFTPVGTFRGIGWKDGSWHDVMWMQRPLGEPGPPRGEPR